MSCLNLLISELYQLAIRFPIICLSLSLCQHELMVSIIFASPTNHGFMYTASFFFVFKFMFITFSPTCTFTYHKFTFMRNGYCIRFLQLMIWTLNASSTKFICSDYYSTHVLYTLKFNYKFKSINYPHYIELKRRQRILVLLNFFSL